MTEGNHPVSSRFLRETIVEASSVFGSPADYVRWVFGAWVWFSSGGDSRHVNPSISMQHHLGLWSAIVQTRVLYR